MTSTRHPWASASFWVGIAALAPAVCLVGIMLTRPPASPLSALWLLVALVGTFGMGVVGILLGIVGLFRREGARPFVGIGISLVSLLPMVGMALFALFASSQM